MSAVIGCGIAAAVFAFMWSMTAQAGVRTVFWSAAIGFAIAAAVAGFMA